MILFDWVFLAPCSTVPQKRTMNDGAKPSFVMLPYFGTVITNITNFSAFRSRKTHKSTEATELLFSYLINDERQMNQAGDTSRRLRERVRYKFPGIGEASSAFESHLETDFE